MRDQLMATSLNHLSQHAGTFKAQTARTAITRAIIHLCSTRAHRSIIIVRDVMPTCAASFLLPSDSRDTTHRDCGSEAVLESGSRGKNERLIPRKARGPSS